ncbi:hypothetical protein [Butyrivibrio fibrisolvens]|uniref:hypothetical protein n=1 Tax=Butyrivibrio fibrisolvens TaxID=831 RepID=UPI0003B5A3A8|nr:hypothetical protein [Butyrivibrio fibrisolvens]
MRKDFNYYDDTDIMEQLDDNELDHTTLIDDEEDGISENVGDEELSNDDYPSNFITIHKALPLDNHPTQDKLIRIMDRYHNGTPEEVEQSTREMLGIMDSYIIRRINDVYPTYKNKYLDDLIQQARMGVLEGMNKYDPMKGAPTTYFKIYIDHEIGVFLTEMVNNTSQYYSKQIKTVMKCISDKKERGIPVTFEDVAMETMVPLKTVKKAVELKNRSFVSIDSGMSIKSEDDSPEQAFLKKEEENTVRCLLYGGNDMHGNKYDKCLTDTEIDIMLKVFGMGDNDPHSYSEISEKTNIPKYNIARTVAAAKAKMLEEYGREKKQNYTRAKNSLKKDKDCISGSILEMSELLQDQNEMADAILREIEEGIEVNLNEEK